VGGEGGDLGIFPSPKASIEGAKSRAYIGQGSKSLFRGGKLEISLSPRASLEGRSSEFFEVPELMQRGWGEKARDFLCPKAYIEGGGEISEIFQFPKPLRRGLNPEYI